MAVLDMNQCSAHGGPVTTLLAVAAAALAVLAVIAWPLFFATIDPDVARARHVPVRLLAAVFLVLLGCAAAEVSQITGALPVFAAGPTGRESAHRYPEAAAANRLSQHAVSAPGRHK